MSRKILNLRHIRNRTRNIAKSTGIVETVGLWIAIISIAIAAGALVLQFRQIEVENALTLFSEFTPDVTIGKAQIVDTLTGEALSISISNNSPHQIKAVLVAVTPFSCSGEVMVLSAINDFPEIRGFLEKDPVIQTSVDLDDVNIGREIGPTSTGRHEIPLQIPYLGKENSWGIAPAALASTGFEGTFILSFELVIFKTALLDFQSHLSLGTGRVLSRLQESLILNRGNFEFTINPDIKPFVLHTINRALTFQDGKFSVGDSENCEKT